MTSFPALMVVYMTISDASWIEPYFAAVPALLAEYGAAPLAGSRQIKRTLPAPDRGATSDIFVFENAAEEGELA